MGYRGAAGPWLTRRGAGGGGGGGRSTPHRANAGQTRRDEAALRWLGWLGAGLLCAQALVGFFGVTSLAAGVLAALPHRASSSLTVAFAEGGGGGGGAGAGGAGGWPQPGGAGKDA